MARCGCAGTTCSCKLRGEGGVTVTGAGTVTNPYVISMSLVLQTIDTPSLDFTLLGSGTSANPYVLSADITLELGELDGVETGGGSAGDVLALQPDGTFALVPPVTAAAGSVATGLSLEGDGSGGDPLSVRLSSLSGLTVSAGGLRIDPWTVEDEGDLDSTFGAIRVGAIISAEDGSGVWVKTDDGFVAIREDTGTTTTVNTSNIVAAAGFQIDGINFRRRNGIVQLRVLARTLIDRETAIETGNVGNIDVATIVPPKFRPIFTAGMGAASEYGANFGAFLTSGGILAIGAMPPQVEISAGTQFTLIGTFIGA